MYLFICLRNVHLLKIDFGISKTMLLEGRDSKAILHFQCTLSFLTMGQDVICYSPHVYFLAAELLCIASDKLSPL